MNKTYNRINWKNYPSDETPVNAYDLNRGDAAIDEIDNRVIMLDNTKATKVEISELIKEVSYDKQTGIITFTRKNGATFTVDTPMEKIQTGIYYDPATEMLTLPLIDGTTIGVDLSRLITELEFLDSDTIAFSVGADGKVSAIVKEGSIKEKHLRPDYLSDIKIEAAKAEASASESEKSAIRSESYAVGGTGIRQNEDVDNAKYYYQQAKQISGGMSGALIPLGTVAFADLQYQAKQVGYMYNISDDFTTDDTFKDGSGYTYPAGTNVYYTADGYWDCLAGTITPEGIGALAIDGDSAENVITFESEDVAEANVWTDVDVLVSGEKHKSILKKMSTMFKNIRYLYKMLGTTDISTLGDGTCTGAIAAQNDALATVNANLRKQYIQCGAVTCTYYTPYFLRAIVTLPVAYSRAIAGFVSKAINTSDASSHVSCLLEGNNKITIFVENENGIFTSSNKQIVYWMTVGVI